MSIPQMILNPQGVRGVFHYCPDCGAASLYAPMPTGYPAWSGHTYQDYECGGKIFYRPDWSVPFRWPCGTFVVASPNLQYSRLKIFPTQR